MGNFFDFNNNFGPVEEESELIPLMTSDDEEAILKESLPESVPILPLRNAVLFPGVVIPISATRDKSVKLIKNANSNNKLIGVVSQKDSNVVLKYQKNGTGSWLALQNPDSERILSTDKKFESIAIKAYTSSNPKEELDSLGIVFRRLSVK